MPRRNEPATRRVSRSSLAELKSGARRRCSPAVVDRVLAVGLHRAAPGCLLDVAVTWRLLDDMIAHGHSRAKIARLLGSNAHKADELYHELMSDVITKRERDRDAQRAHRSRQAVSAAQAGGVP